MKTKGLTIWVTIVFVMFTACSLRECSQDKAQTKTGSIAVTGVTANDLQQVMVFGLDDENNKMVFVKNFFTAHGTMQRARKDMHKYMNMVKMLVGQKVQIEYHEDVAGDFVIDSIHRQL